MPDLFVLGNFVVDIIAKPLGRLPDAGKLTYLDTLETHAGGNAPNTAGALARLGEGVAALGRVGEDLYGRYLLETLQGYGVETRHVVRDPQEPTGVTVVAVDDRGERSFLYRPGANNRFNPEDLPWHALAQARHLHFSAYFILPALEGEAAATVLRRARSLGLTTSLDVCWDGSGRWIESLAPCLPQLDLCMPSEDEARALTGSDEPTEMAARLLAGGCRAVVLKLGERGALYADAGGTIFSPAFRVPVKETTGAGDCFIAGFLCGRRQGWDPARCLRLGNACGARAVSHIGAVSGMLPAAEMLTWMSRTPTT